MGAPSPTRPDVGGSVERTWRPRMIAAGDVGQYRPVRIIWCLYFGPTLALEIVECRFTDELQFLSSRIIRVTDARLYANIFACHGNTVNGNHHNYLDPISLK